MLGRVITSKIWGGHNGELRTQAYNGGMGINYQGTIDKL